MRFFLQSSGVGILLLLVGCSNLSYSGKSCRNKYPEESYHLTHMNGESVHRSINLPGKLIYGSVKLNDGPEAQCFPIRYRDVPSHKWTDGMGNLLFTKCGVHEFYIGRSRIEYLEENYMDFSKIFDKQHDLYPLKLVNSHKHYSCTDISEGHKVRDLTSTKNTYKVVSNPNSSNPKYIKDRLYTIKIDKQKLYFIRKKMGPDF